MGTWSARIERLTNAEATISRQEQELSHARSQVSALQAQMATQRSSTRFIDQEQMNALVNQSQKHRSRDVDAQLQVLESRLYQVSEDLERAEGDKSTLEAVKRTMEKDRTDIRELQQIVRAAEINLRRQQRLTGAEDRIERPPQKYGEDVCRGYARHEGK